MDGLRRPAPAGSMHRLGRRQDRHGVINARARSGQPASDEQTDGSLVISPALLHERTVARVAG